MSTKLKDDMGASHIAKPKWLWFFCFALMGSASGINAVLIALAFPELESFGISGLVMAGFLGVLLGIFPANWLANRIGADIEKS